MEKLKAKEEGVILGELQLLLAEKRTSLAYMRTGIAILVLPMSVLSVLIATSKYYVFKNVLHFIIPVLILCALLALFGLYAIVRSILRIRRYDELMLKIKKQNESLAKFLD